MIVRVTLPTGAVSRYEVAPTDTVQALREKVARDAGATAALLVLSADRALSAALSLRLSLSAAGVSHGSMLFAGTVSKARDTVAAQPQSQGSPSPAPAPAAITPPPEEITPANCPAKHGPHTVCVRCLPRGDKQRPACNHAPGIRCPNCSQSSGTLGCKHGPGTRCVNCPPLVETPALSCNHPPYVRCPKCASQDAPAAAPVQAAAPGTTIKCNHGPHGRCANCMPTEKVEEGEDDGEVYCRNHGPNGSCVECMHKREQRLVHIKRQADPTCTRVKVDYNAASGFQSYVMLHKFSVNRIGWLYGVYEDSGVTTVHAIYEPPQESQGQYFSMLEDPGFELVETVSGLLELRVVGWIFSHGARQHLLTAMEIEKMAELQNKHGSQFVTMVLSPAANGKSKLEAFQVSDQAMLMQRKGMFGQTADPAYVTTTKPVVIENRNTHTVDSHWLIVNVPVVAAKSCFALCTFPVENRLDAPQGRDDLRDHLKQHGKKPFHQWASDFHFLIWVCREILREDPEIVAICESVHSRTPCDGAEEIIRACC